MEYIERQSQCHAHVSYSLHDGTCIHSGHTFVKLHQNYMFTTTETVNKEFIVTSQLNTLLGTWYYMHDMCVPL